MVLGLPQEEAPREKLSAEAAASNRQRQIGPTEPTVIGCRPEGDITLYPVGSLGSAPKIPHARTSQLQVARINLLERRLSALPDNDDIATLVRMRGPASAAPTFAPARAFSSAPSGSRPVSRNRRSSDMIWRAFTTLRLVK